MKIKYTGQSLVEIVVAIGIVVLLVTGLIAATTSSLRFGQMSKDRTQALQYAKEGLEIVQIIKDADWASIPQTGNVKYCLSKGQQDLGSQVSGDCPPTIDTIFSRTISFSNDGICTVDTFCRKVTVSVSWMEKELRTVILTSYITNWKTQ